MAFEGTLKDFPLPDILQLIALQRKTGVLTLEGPDDAATVYFQDGALVWARFRRQPLEERMRRLLPLRGLVTEAHMAEAARAQGETGQGLWNVLAQRRLIPKEEWDQTVTLEIQEGLYRLLRWREGTYRFETRTSLDLGVGRIPRNSSQCKGKSSSGTVLGSATSARSSFCISHLWTGNWRPQVSCP